MDVQGAEEVDDSVGEGEPPGREPWLRFALVFGALAVGSEVLYYAVTLDSQAFRAYLEVLTKISGVLLNAFGSDVSIYETRITNSRFAVEVAAGCDAIQVCSLLAAAVIAFPIALKRKLRGLALGILWLQFLNLMRIITLFLIGEQFSGFFKTAHEVVWPGVLIVITIITWILWVRWETREEYSLEHEA
jgi:exosortase H (IPTLxxWG-CTERM-specific)